MDLHLFDWYLTLDPLHIALVAAVALAFGWLLRRAMRRPRP